MAKCIDGCTCGRHRDRTGWKHTEETSAKMRGRSLSPEHRAKLKIARNARPPASEETRRLMSEAHVEQWADPEARSTQAASIRATYGARRDERIQAWLAGEAAYEHLPKAFWRWLIEQAGHRCERCGWAEMHPRLGYVPLEVDHRDGDRSNNARENLWVLCANCHLVQPTSLAKKTTHRAWVESFTGR